MALSTQHRNSIYTKFVPILGVEDAGALMDQFPASDLHELATKGFVREEIGGVRTEIAEFRGEVHTEFAAIRGEMASGFAAVRGEMASGFAAVRGEMQAGVAELRGEMQAGFDSIDGKIHRLFARQTMWLFGAMSGFLVLMTAILGLLITQT